MRDATDLAVFRSRAYSHLLSPTLAINLLGLCRDLTTIMATYAGEFGRTMYEYLVGSSREMLRHGGRVLFHMLDAVLGDSITRGVHDRCEFVKSCLFISSRPRLRLQMCKVNG